MTDEQITFTTQSPHFTKAPLSHLEEIDRIISRCDSYTRLGEILNWEGGTSRFDWLRLLGDWWQNCDSIRDHRLKLRKALGTAGPIRPMMTDEENAYYDALPESVACYRGCDASRVIGASWTLDWNVANCFPFTQRYMTSDPVVVTARVKKTQILAVKLGRDELEIITFSAKRLTVAPADKTRAMARFAQNQKEMRKWLDDQLAQVAA